MIGKVHSSNGKIIFAACDKELLNKKIKHEDTVIEINESFFGNTPVTSKNIIKEIENCDSANFFGKKVCDVLLKNNLIEKTSIIYIDKIPHTQIYRL